MFFHWTKRIFSSRSEKEYVCACRGDYLNFFRTSHVHWFLVVLDHDTRALHVVTSHSIATFHSTRSLSYEGQASRDYISPARAYSLFILFPLRAATPSFLYSILPRQVMCTASSLSRAANRYSFTLPLLIFNLWLCKIFTNFILFPSKNICTLNDFG